MDNDMIWIGNDHGGYELKKKLIAEFESRGYSFHDVGCDSADIVRYPYYAEKVSVAVASGKASRGILICSTGIGMSMMANKYKGVRASVCTDPYMAKMTRKHNDANVLCLGGKITGVDEAVDIVDVWLNTEFIGGRHCISLSLMKDAENALLADAAEVLDPAKANG